MSTKIRAKFKVTSIEHIESTRAIRDGEGKKTNRLEPCAMANIKLQAVYGTGSPENERFWEATPSGQVTLSVINPEAAEAFALGKEYYLDFTPAS